MDTSFISTELYRGRTYPRQSPGHTKNCISVSSDGFVAFIDKHVWRVLNPFTNIVYSFPGPVGKEEEEEDETSTKKRVSTNFVLHL